MNKKRITFLTFVFFLTAVLGTSGELIKTESKAELNKIISTVNGVLIKKKDFKWAYSSELIRLTGTIGYLTDEETIELKKTTFERLINRELLFQESRRHGIEIDPMDVELAYKRARSEMMAPVDHQRIEDTLDLSVADIKEEFRRAYAAQKLVDQRVTFDHTVTENDVESFYTSNPKRFDIEGRVKVSHILKQFPENPNPAQKAMIRADIESIKQRLDKGEKFEELARQCSDSFDRANSGNIGFLTRGKSDVSFEKAAYALNPGEVSDIVESSYGYHIIKVTEREPNSIISLDKAKDEIVKFILAERENTAIGKLIDGLRQKSVIEIFMNPVEIE